MSQLQQEQNKSIRLAAKILVLIFILFWMLISNIHVKKPCHLCHIPHWLISFVIVRTAYE